MSYVGVLEGTHSIQFVCPHCEKVDTDSSGFNVLLAPPDYFDCPYCGKRSRAITGSGHEEKTAL